MGKGVLEPARPASKVIMRSMKAPNGTSATAARPSMGPSVLEFGEKTRPTTILVMFHGQGDNAQGTADGWADVWAAGLPGCLVLVPESPHITVWDEHRDTDDPGRDWHRHWGSHDITDKDASVRKIQRVARKTFRAVNCWLDEVLRKYGLKNRDLMLSGFSQGNSVACIVGAQRGAKAVVICGGVCTESVFSSSVRTDDLTGRPFWPRWEELMPKKAAPRTKIFAVNGLNDATVQRKYFVPMLANFDTEFRWEPGLAHDGIFAVRFRSILLRWMQKVLRSQ